MKKSRPKCLDRGNYYNWLCFYADLCKLIQHIFCRFISKPKVEVDRKALAERFKNVIKDALTQRLLKFGLDIKKTSKISEDKCKEISHQLKNNRPKTEEFTSLRKQLKSEMRAAVQGGNKKPRRHRQQQLKISAPPMIIPIPIKPASPVEVASPVRAPIPAPRSSKPNGLNLMARDGEAASVFIKPSTSKLENHQVIQSSIYIFTRLTRFLARCRCQW